ncbi:MAG: hypothetical protein K0R18_1996 [Bacillales bacterium]|jgi:hypothetical protein|nr:hypothetical protein [Bacillales bacterium]
MACDKKNPYKGIPIADMPEVLTAEHIAGHLDCSIQKIYDLCKLSEKVGGLKSFRFGKLIRVSKEDFISWKAMISGQSS